MNVSALTRLSPGLDVHARRFQDELVVLDLVAGEYFSLDEVGARIWTEIAAGRSLEAIVNTLATDYDVEVSRLRADVFALADELVRHGLVSERTEDIE